MKQSVFRRVHRNDDGRKKLLEGINELYEAVSSTLGAAGKTVILEEAVTGVPYPTKDGVTVAEYIEPFDPVANLGASFLREAAKKTAEIAGDGTTTSVVLAHAILDKAIPKLKDNNFRQLIEGIKRGRDKVLKELENKATEVTESNLIDIASISANNDKVLGALIAEAYTKVGIDGTVVIGESKTNSTYIEVLDGSSINSGAASHHFLGDATKLKFDKANILILDQKLSNIWKIQDILEGAIKSGDPLLIIGELDQAPLATLAMNKIKNGFKICVIEPPLHGNQRKAVLLDLAKLTGAKVVGEEYGNSLETVSFDNLGQAKSITIEQNRTIFQFNDDAREDLEDLVATLKEQLPESEGAQRGLIKYRLNLLTGKLAEIKVGAVTQTAFKELRDRVDDAVRATQCALEEGIVPGGGVVLKDITTKLFKDAKSDGERILYLALTAPMYKIASNAGLDLKDFPEVDKRGKGLDVLRGKVVSAKSEGIIDPVKVTKNAVINAVEVANTVLGTDIIVTNLRQSDI